MGFLGIGAMEALVILVIALIIFGPGRLPEMMGEAGRAVRDFRRATRELTGDFQDSITEVRGTYEELERDMRTTAKDLKRDTENIAKEINTTVADAGKLDSTPRSTSNRTRTARPLDQLDEATGEEDMDVAKYFPQRDDAEGEPGHSEQPAGGSNRASKPKRAARPKPAPAVVPATASNGASHDTDDLLSTEDGDDLLAVDE